MPDPVELGLRVTARCAELGFAAVGISDARPTNRESQLRDWLAAGKHGDMDFLARTIGTLVDPAQELPGVRSVIMVADLYHARGAGSETPTGTTGRIARYARGRDYHGYIKKRLHRLNDELRAEFPEHEFRTFVDTAPVLEREYAARAGLGWIGRHTLAIHPRIGSYVLLGGTLTTMEIAPRPELRAFPDHCGTCTRCIEACPTQAIGERTVDATRCISYLTIERQGPIDERWHAAIGDWMYGCDICQEVCPHNAPTPRHVNAPLAGGGGRVGEHYKPKRTGFDAFAVLGWDEAARREAFTSSAMKRASLAMMKRNALIVLANAVLREPGADWAAAARARIAELASASEEEPMVRETARVSLARLSSPARGPVKA